MTDDPLAAPASSARSSLDEAMAALLARPTPTAPLWPVADHPCAEDDVGPYEPCESCGALVSVDTFTPDRGPLAGETRTDHYEFVRRECDLWQGVHGLVYAPHTPDRCREVRGLAKHGAAGPRPDTDADSPGPAAGWRRAGAVGPQVQRLTGP